LYRPAPSAAIFISLIVKAPIIPIINAVVALFILSIEKPLPALKSMSIRRSLVLKIVMLVFQAFLSILFYQVRTVEPVNLSLPLTVLKGTNAAIWSLVAIICYIRAVALGEKIEEAKANRGQGGRA
jgi:hypothetical protein